MVQIREIDLRQFIAKRAKQPCCFEEMNRFLSCMAIHSGAVDNQCMEERKTFHVCMKRTVSEIRTKGKLSTVDQVLKLANDYGLVKTAKRAMKK